MISNMCSVYVGPLKIILCQENRLGRPHSDVSLSFHASVHLSVRLLIVQAYLATVFVTET